MSNRLFKLPPEPLITRFAPSPTGYMHMGHVISLCYVFGIAALMGSKVFLRIEDHDFERCRKEYDRSIIDDMAWLDFIPDNWEEFTQKKYTPFRQSNWCDCYLIVLEQLEKLGVTYRCTCSRKQLPEAAETDELYYPGTCRNKVNIDKDYGVRLIVEDRIESFWDMVKGKVEQNPARQCGDFLLRDRRKNFTYNFAVVVDDIRQGVNLIIRGEDIFHCTGRQIALNRYLNRPANTIYYHHPLVYDLSGKKLSKRTMAEGIISRRLSGDTPERVIGEALHLAGLLPHSIPVKSNEIPKIFSETLFPWKSS